MTTTLTIERQVHFQAQARGRKQLRVGPEPPRPAPDPGRVPRVARLMALAIRFEGLLDEGQAAQALALFDPLWQRLAPAEQARVLGLLVQRVDYDGARCRVSITFHPSGIKALADEWAGRQEGRSA